MGFLTCFTAPPGTFLPGEAGAICCSSPAEAVTDESQSNCVHTTAVTTITQWLRSLIRSPAATKGTADEMQLTDAAKV